MDFDFLNSKTAASLDEIRVRVAHALARHPLCRNVRFDIVSVPRTRRGGQLDGDAAIGRAARGLGGLRNRRGHPGCLRSGLSCLILLGFLVVSP